MRRLFLPMLLFVLSARAHAQPVVPFLHVVTWHQYDAAYNSIAAEATVLPCRTGPKPNAAAPCAFARSSDAGYASLDPAIIDAQNRDLAAMGSVALISWWGVNDIAGDAFLDVYLSRPSTVPIAILYEMNGLLTYGHDGQTFPFDNSLIGRANSQAFVGDLYHLRDKYFQNPRYAHRFVRMGGRPVVFLWASRLIQSLGFPKTSDEVRSFSYLIGAELDWHGPRRAYLAQVLPGLDAISDYGSYIPEFAQESQGALDDAYLARTFDNLRQWSTWLSMHSPQTALMPTMTYAYRDRQGNPSLSSTRLQACRFAEMMYDFITTVRSGPPMVSGFMQPSFNEHYEGTSVEDTQEYGSMYAQITREVFGPVGTGRCR